MSNKVDNKMNKEVTVTVTGGAGQIGYALLFRLASGEVFGPDVKVRLNLLEITPALPACEGVAMELQDCAFPQLAGIKITDDPNEGMKDTNWAVLVGAMPRKQGMERADLLEKNAQIFSVQGKAINDNAAKDVRVFVVGNPCNTNALIAMANAPDIPQDRFYAMTMLDELRASAALAVKAGVGVDEISDMTIWGNHSATQYPDFYNAKIGGKSAAEVIGDVNWLQNDFIPFVQKRGAQVIKARGASSAASAANAILRGLKSLVHDTPAGKTYSMCCLSNGEYGVDPGLIYSFPCRTTNGKVEIVEGVSHPEDFAKNCLQVTLDELRQERDTVRGLGLIPS